MTSSSPGPPDLALNYTHENGTSSSVGTSRTQGSGITVATSATSEAARSYAYANAFGLEVSAGVDEGFVGSVTASYNHEESVANESTMAFSSENIRENSLALEQAESFENSNNVTVSDGDIDVTVQITNTGNITYTLENLFLSAFTVTRTPRGENFGAVGNMVFSDADIAFPSVALSPGQSTTQLNFTAGGNDVALMKSLMQDSLGLMVKPATYNLLDQNGQPYNFAATNIGSLTAQIMIDNNGNNIKHSIAVHGNPDNNITLLDALQQILQLPVVVYDSTGNAVSVDLNGNPIAEGYIHSVDGTSGNDLTNFWMIAHEKQQNGTSERIRTIYLPPDPKDGWSNVTSTQITNLVDSFNPAQIVLNAGDVVHLVFLQDNDNDGLSNQREFLFGSNPDNKFTDNDLLDDNTEVLGWEIKSINKDGTTVTQHVYSDPTVADTDGDNVPDDVEFGPATTPVGLLDASGNPYNIAYYRRNPTSSDTDGDGISDFRDDYLNGALSINVYDSLTPHDFVSTSIDALQVPTIEYTLPLILKDIITNAFDQYDSYLIRREVAAGVAATYPDLDQLPADNTPLTYGDIFSCSANSGDPACGWEVVSIRNFKRSSNTLPVPGGGALTQVFADTTRPVPLNGSAQYRLLYVIDGVFYEYPVATTVSGSTDQIEITMHRGTFSNKRTLLGNHGRAEIIPLLSGGDRITANLSEVYARFGNTSWFVDSTYYYQIYKRDFNIFFGFEYFVIQYNKTPFHPLQGGGFVGALSLFDNPTPFPVEAFYANSLDMWYYLNGQEVGDGTLDLEWKLELGTDVLVSSSNKWKIKGSLQTERTATVVSGETITDIIDEISGLVVTPDVEIFTQFGVLTSDVNASTVVNASAPDGGCHPLIFTLKEYDSSLQQYNVESPVDNDILICPSSTLAGAWEVTYKDGISSKVVTLRKNNILDVAIIPMVFSWSPNSSNNTISGTINTTMEIRIK